jgi:predicted ATPase/signal transduction histidine kinase
MHADVSPTPLPTSFRAEPLHGREEERQRLQAVLARIEATGTTEVVAISGRGGVGKSTLVQWLLQRAQDGACAVGQGKCDKVNAEIPFAAVAQIVRMLTLDALGGPQAALDQLAARWLALLSGHGNSITELVPEAEHILGNSGPALSLLTPLGQGRIEQAILRTFEAFSAPGRPAVIFLDDLQWADDATLSLLKSFVSTPPANVLFIGAYRDDEGAFSRQYLQSKHASRSAAVHFSDLALAPLSLDAFTHIIAETLAHPAARLHVLIDVLFKKSGGNPYFAQQLLQTWIDDGVLAPAGGAWSWDDAALEMSAYADHVIDLIIQRISRLPAAQKTILQNLSCIGGQCGIDLLASVGDDAGADADAGGRTAFDAALAQLAGSGLVVRRGDTCAFQHDRVFEAAYALIAPEAKSPAHAYIARRMIAFWDGQLTTVAYDIGNQIEKVARADILEAEQPRFVFILAMAARRAQRASAVDRAHDYNATARSMMDASWWDRHFALAYEVALIECECLIAKGDMARASEQIAAILARDLSSAERAPVHRLEAVLHTLESHYEEAIVAALAGLAATGVVLARHPGPEQMRAAYLSVMEALGARSIAALRDLPLCEDDQVKNTMALLSTLISSFFTDDDIMFTHLAKMVELTLQHGVTPDSPYGLAWFGVFIASHYDAFSDGYAFGVLALALVDRHGFESTRIGTLVALDQVAVWTQPLEVALDYVHQASTRGSLSGDIGMACYACNHIVSDMLAMGTALAGVADAAEYGINLTRSIGYRDIELLIAAQMDFINRMTRGYAPGDRETWIAACNDRIGEARSLPTKFWAALYAGMAEVYAHQWDTASAFLARCLAMSTAVPAHINVAECHLLHALALSRHGRESRTHIAAVLQQECTRLGVWAGHNRRTFLNKLQLLQGEAARFAGDYLRALMHFEQSAQAAHGAGFVHEQALAHELAAALNREHGLDIAAARHFHLAKGAYARWGALHKADAIEVADGLPEPAWRAGGTEPDDKGGSAALEMGLKTAQALAQASVKEKLVDTMFSSLLEHADAQYGALLRVTDGVAILEASGRLSADGLATSVADVEPGPEIMPMRLLNIVLRTRQSIVIHDAANDGVHFLQTKEVAGLRSVLCLPLLRADELIGVLYLENNRAPGVFNPARVLRLELMASQIAIALGSARLYEQLIRANDARTQAENNLSVARAELVKNASVTVLANLAASIAHEINQPLGAIVISAEAATRWLDREEPNIGRAKEGLQRIKTDGMRAAQIIRALRALAKKSAVNLENLSICEVVTGVVAMLSGDFAKHGVTTHVRLGPDCMVAGDRIQLQQVMLNLLNNAVEAMAHLPGNQRKELSIMTAPTASGISILVQDNGPGLPAADIERIFEPFYTTKGEGLGMGLAICMSVAEAHGGTLTAANNPAGGTTFALDIPVIQAPQAT